MQRPRGLYMSVTEQFAFGIISDFESRKISRKEAATLLEIDERSVSRKAVRFRKDGLLGFQHGNRRKIPSNKTSDALRLKVLDLIKEKYFDFNVTHAREMLKKNDSIIVSYSLLYSWCRSAKLVKRSKRRHAKARHFRSRLPCEGLMLQLDGSHHAWNGKDVWVLIAAIDDATSKIPWAEFFDTEDTLNCMTVLQRIIEKFGIPEVIYTDKAGWFGGTTKREGFNHFTAACDELGIRIIFANSPQAKGRIERAWDTFQDRIIPEMRLKKIRIMSSANEYLQQEFLPNYWEKSNTVPARLSEVRYRKLPDRIDLNEVLCLKEHRQVKSNHTISWENNIYKVTPYENISIRSRNIELRTYQNLEKKAFFAGREIKIECIQQAPDVKLLRTNGVLGMNREALKNLVNSPNNISVNLRKVSKKERQNAVFQRSYSATAEPIKRKRGRPRKYFIEEKVA